MKLSTVLLAVLATAMMVLAVACAKVPETEIAAATQALEAARTAEAATWAATEWEAAETAMEAANAEIETQKAKFGLTRSYTKAKELLTAAEQAAATAKEAAVAGKERARQEAQTALDTVNASVAKAEELYAQVAACPRHPKGFKADLELLRGTLDGYKPSVADIESAITNGAYLDAKAQAETLDGNVQTLVTDLENAKAKLGC